MTDLAERAARRYLEVVKSALLDEHYLDNELRIEYLATRPAGAEPEPDVLRDPVRHLAIQYERLVRARAAGRSGDVSRSRAYFPYTDMGRAQLDFLDARLTALRARGIAGDLAEISVGRGGGAIFMRAFLEAYEIPGTRVWLLDRFRAVDTDAGAESPTPPAGMRYRADVGQVGDGFARFGLHDDRVRILSGRPQDTLADAPIERLALVRIGEGIGNALRPVLTGLQPYLAPGSTVIVEGVDRPEIEAAIADARDRAGVQTPIERIDWNSVAWEIGPLASSANAPAAAPVVTAPRHRAASVPPAPADAVDLTVVVVFFNMQREGARTLLSLSRSYQRGVEEIDYEVIAVDNGSRADQRLGEEYVRSFGPEFRYLDLGADASPSPTVALNRGAAVARGRNIAFMIDGAHVLTPGVLRLGLAALRTYEPAIVATQQWYVGPGQQGDALLDGYDQAAEDQLFKRIRWPSDGYRLFEIGHFIGDRDWFDGIVESNCVFVPRELLERYGGFDESFAMPGGGYANLELYERMCAIPDVHVASILGEGSFHQVHGGTTTNIEDAAARRELVRSYQEHFEDLVGRRLMGVNKPVYYVGAMSTKAARRTRSRRQIALSFDGDRDPLEAAAGGVPLHVPDELKIAAIEAAWNSRTWCDATWLGHAVGRFPTDLYAYQELVVSSRPGVVVLVSDDHGLDGRAQFFASVFDARGDGRVVAVGSAPLAARTQHPRVDHVVGRPDDLETSAEVHRLVGLAPNAVVFLGLGTSERVAAGFELYADLVPVGGYVVVENTIVNGRPVESAFGPGPFEAVVDVLHRHREFFADPHWERYLVTFNRHGFLKRMRPDDVPAPADQSAEPPR